MISVTASSAAAGAIPGRARLTANLRVDRTVLPDIVVPIAVVIHVP